MISFGYVDTGNLQKRIKTDLRPPIILRNPVTRTSTQGDTLTFSVLVSEVRECSYEWKFNGTKIPGATGDSLLLTNVTAADEGQYTVSVTNSAGSVTSDPAELLLDTNRNGLPDGWEKKNFGDRNSQRAAGDPDGDGISNIDEFFDGTDPNSKTSLRPRLIAYSDLGGSVIVAPMKLSYDFGETATLTAGAVAPSQFIGWEGDLSGNSNPMTLTMNGSKTVRARFTSTVPIPAGLVSCWRAEGDARDAVGTNHGDLREGASFTQGKVFGQSFLFDNSNKQFIEIPDAPTLRPKSITLETWVTFSEDRNIEVIFSKPFGTDAIESFSLWRQANAIRAVVGNVGGQGGPRDAGFTALFSNIRNRWYHLAFTFDDDSKLATLYIDGRQVAIKFFNVSIPYDDHPLLIGRGNVNGNPNFFLAGRIDEPSFYDRALTADEIFDLFKADLKDFSRPYFTSPLKFPPLIVGTTFTEQLSTKLGVAPIVFALQDGSLPSGLTLASTGVLSGNPSASGVSNFIVRATDAAGNFAEQSFDMSGFESIAAPAGLVGWWPGNGNAKDIKNNNDGSLLGGAKLTSANVGEGFTFDSDDDGVTIPHSANLDMNSGGFTAEFWIRGGRSQPQSLSTLVDKSHGFVDSTGWVFQAEREFGRLSFSVGANGTFPKVNSLGNFLDGKFHHVAGTWDGTSMRLFVDGVLQGSAALTSPSNNTRPLVLGFAAGGGTPQRFFRGQIDELSLYDRALSEMEIGSIVKAGPAGKR